MLIPRKSHSRVKSRNSQVSIETFDFTRVGTFTGMIWAGSPAGAKGGGQAIAGRSPTLFPANVATPSIDRHSGQWCVWNVAKTAGGGGYRGVRPEKRNGGSASVRWDRESTPAPIGRRWSTSRVDGRAKWQAAAGSLAPWRTRQNAGWGRDHRPDHRSPVGAARHLSGLSCCLYRQTEAAAFAPMQCCN